MTFTKFNFSPLSGKAVASKADREIGLNAKVTKEKAVPTYQAKNGTPTEKERMPRYYNTGKREKAMLKKEIKERFGTHYLLGIDAEGKKHYLKKASWDCGWYWGFGYIHTFTSRDIGMHYHFDGFEKNCNMYDGFKKAFTDSVLTDSELCKLCELMETFYVLKNTAEVLGRGGAHYTTNPCSEIIKNTDEVKRINEIVLPAIFEEIYTLLSK